MKWQTTSANRLVMPQSWQQFTQGAQYCTAISDYFAAWQTKIFAEPILNIGGLSAEIQLDRPLCHQILLASEISPKMTALYGAKPHFSLIQASPYTLPFSEKSIHACFLINTLNFCQDPSQLLREVARVLTPDGYLFLSIFNPFSPLLIKTQPEKLPWRALCHWQIINWLHSHPFDLLAVDHIHIDHKIPLPSLLSPITAIVAQKRTFSLSSSAQKGQYHNPHHLQPLDAFRSFPTK